MSTPKQSQTNFAKLTVFTKWKIKRKRRQQKIVRYFVTIIVIMLKSKQENNTIVFYSEKALHTEKER